MFKPVLIAAVLMSVGVPSVAVAQDQGDQPEIWCSAFHPGATYEELVLLCANDTPPPGYNPTNPGVFPPGPTTPPTRCNSAGSRLCDIEDK